MQTPINAQPVCILTPFDLADTAERFEVIAEEIQEARQALVGALQHPDNARALIRAAIAKLDTANALCAAGRSEFVEGGE